MRRVKSPGHAQRFLSAFEGIAAHFRLCRHRVPAAEYRAARTQQCASWKAGNRGAVGGVKLRRCARKRGNRRERDRVFFNEGQDTHQVDNTLSSSRYASR